jgi:pimeloyl-ACP methyl ester carboxylesterase
VIIEASDGCNLYAEAHGEGVPLVLSCALCTTHENWRPQVAPLVAAGARVVLWDYRGHGKSGAPEDPAAYTLERVMADLLHVLDATAPGEGVILGGLSFGGLLSLHTALATPERARALLLVDTGPGFKKPEAQERWEAQVERTASYVEAKGARAFSESKAAPTLVGTQPDLPAAKAAAEAIATQTSHGLANFARGVAGPASPVIDTLSEIQCPALVMVGEHDAPYLRAAEVLAARIPKARSVTLAGAGHIVNIEAEAAFNEAAAGFVESLCG